MCHQEKAFSSEFFPLLPQVIFLIGNKCDLDAQRDVTYEEAKQFAEENGMDKDSHSLMNSS